MKKPNCIEKRSFLYGSKTSVEERIRLGEEFLAEGAFADALNFFAAAEYREGLERVRDHAVEEGDAFLLRQVARARGLVEVTPDRWARAAAQAERAGKLRFAAIAYREAGREDEATRLEGRAGVSETAEHPGTSTDVSAP
jgi:hypothetical protein